MKFVRLFLAAMIVVLLLHSKSLHSAALFKVNATGSAADVNITLCLNAKARLSCQDYKVSALKLAIKTTIPNHSYPYAGIKVNTPGYRVANLGIDCLKGFNGYCFFSVSDTTPHKINLIGDALFKINHFIVYVAENHSFDNMFGNWEGVNGVANATNTQKIQVNQDGAIFPKLCGTNPIPPLLGNQCFPNQGPVAETAGNCTFPFNSLSCMLQTSDPTHKFYQTRYQLNNGMNNRFMSGNQHGGYTMLRYDTTTLPIYQYLHQQGHPNYAILDNFFQASFGDTFLNMQWLVAAATPIWEGAANDPNTLPLRSIVDTNAMPVSYPSFGSNPPFYVATAAVNNGPLAVTCEPGLPTGTVCGDYIIDQPPLEGLPGSILPPLFKNITIADRFQEANIDWAYYTGDWNVYIGTGLQRLAINPFSWYESFIYNSPNYTNYLRDESEFLERLNNSITSCVLPTVSFIHPAPPNDEHPSVFYTIIPGQNHQIDIIEALKNSACAKDTMFIAIYDEAGGYWDHVSPPGQGNTPGVYDAFGPGPRVAALVISPMLQGDFVIDSTQYDTTSIIATIERRFNLFPLTTRDARVNDLSEVFNAMPYQ